MAASAERACPTCSTPQGCHSVTSTCWGRPGQHQPSSKRSISTLPAGNFDLLRSDGAGLAQDHAQAVHRREWRVVLKHPNLHTAGCCPEVSELLCPPGRRTAPGMCMSGRARLFKRPTSTAQHAGSGRREGGCPSPPNPSTPECSLDPQGTKW